MSGPGGVTLVVDPDAIERSTRAFTGLLAASTFTAVTRMTCDGSAAEALLRGGAFALGQSRHVNLWNLRGVGVRAPLWLLRPAEPELALETVRVTDASRNCELETVKALDRADASAGDLEARRALALYGCPVSATLGHRAATPPTGGRQHP